jgi:hypothetical protein
MTRDHSKTAKLDELTRTVELGREETRQAQIRLFESEKEL